MVKIYLKIRLHFIVGKAYAEYWGLDYTVRVFIKLEFPYIEQINNMNIEIYFKELQILEDYSIFDSNDFVSIYNSMAKQIDRLQIAKFNCSFLKYDKIFTNLDFAFDFGSIACYLKDLESFLESKTGNYKLYFYEKNRIIEFFFADSKLNFILLDTTTIGHETFVINDTLDYHSVRFTILKLRNDFILLLKFFFPIGYKILESGKYIV